MPGELIHRKGSLFEALKEPKPVLVHAVSTAGVWGAGIALEFQKRFPRAYASYEQDCENHFFSLLGSYGSWSDDLDPTSPVIAWLYTAQYPGRQESVQHVASYTEKAVKKMISDAANFIGLSSVRHTFHSPRINSGLFGVPWEFTEAAIKNAMTLPLSPFDWHVWTP